MRFSIEKKDLYVNIIHLLNIIPVKNTMPILTNYLIEADETEGKIKITATDLEITVVVEFSASVIEGGKVAVLAKYFNEIIYSLPEAMVNLFIDEDILRITCEKSKFQLLCADTSQFPLIPTLNYENAIEIDANLFKKMIDSTLFAVSTEINRPIFTGVCWKIKADKQLMVATDGKKIAEFTLHNHIDIQKPIELIIPPKSLHFLDKVISENTTVIKVLPESNRIIFICDNYVIYSHIIEGTYPDYTIAIPLDNNNIMRINKAKFKNIIKRVSLLASEETGKVMLDITDSILAINSFKSEEGEADEKIEDFQYEGSPLVIAFNYRFLMAIINVIETEDIEFHFGIAKSPILIFNTEKNDIYETRYLLMPLRLE